jgi:P-type Cu+ transporter
MTCANCALTVSDFLKKQGMKDVRVNLMGGDVSFDKEETIPEEKIRKGIESLGYKVVDERVAVVDKKKFLETPLQKFWFCLPFTLVLLLHMLPWHIDFLMNPWIQLALCLPVYVVGMSYFGKSALKSLRNGMPNMNVLIALGATAAFVYSLLGALMGLGENYLYFETAATIITLVFLGNWMEDVSVSATQRALKDLTKEQKVTATMIAYDDQHQEQLFPVEQNSLREGDLILIRTGEQVPADAKILAGECEVNESILTGESLPIIKKSKDKLIGGSIISSGTVKAQVTATGKNTVLSQIVAMATQAQAEKPPVQQLADKISAIFVPAVLAIAVATIILNYFVFGQTFSESLMRSIAVLVIACPCAMGLATPAAIAVGLGRSARNGILFKDAKSLEVFRKVKRIVFDKTGTLTTGNFTIENWQSIIDEQEFKALVFSLEKYSTHPIAKSISIAWKTSKPVSLINIKEVKGSGITAEDRQGNTYAIGSVRLLPANTDVGNHNIYLIRNNEVIGWIDVTDEIRPEASEVVSYFKRKGLKTYLLSGDSRSKCEAISKILGIDHVFAEQTPAEKLAIITELNSEEPTAMVGDGINDAPALAKASVAVSISDASQIAIQNADVVLMNSGLQNLPQAMGLGKHTYLTIKQNLFWAFSYNIVAIPIAAAGFLHPGIAALVMGISDVVLAINSVRLRWKKVI